MARPAVEALAQIALEAGAAIMTVYARLEPGAAKTKGDGSPVTEADTLAERIILDGLAKVASDTPVVAEESVAAGRVPDTAGGAFFLVDPLDGTKEFINKNGEFTVNIALIEQGQPVMGVVYAPAIEQMYVGEVGKSARLATVADGVMGDWAAIQANARPAGGLKVIASRSHLSDETKAFIERFEVADFMSAGSSLKFCRVAAGAADLYPRLARTMEWDTAAADAVLRAAGGCVYTMDGAPMVYGKRNQANDTDFANPWFVAAGAWQPIEA